MESSAKNTDLPTDGPAVKSTVDPREEDSLQAGLVKFWYQLVFHIATAGHIKNIPQVQQQSEVTTGHQETGAGKLCEDHVHSCECVSGQKPRLTKEGEDNFLQNGCPPVLGATRRHHRRRRICLQQDQLKSEVTDEPQETGAERKRGMTIEIRTTVCKIFRNGWRSTQTILRTSQNSDSERPTKVVSKSSKHSFFTHFPKDRNCEVCLRTKMTRACRRRTGEAVPRAEKFGDLITAHHKGPQ